MNFQGGTISSLSSDVEISVSCENLQDMDFASKSDPTCVLFVRSSNDWHEFARSEKITDCLNPKWTTKFQLKYVFEERQLVKFGIYDIDSRSADLRNHDPLGELECSLGEIMANQSKGFCRNLSRGQGKILIHAEEVSNTNAELTLKFEAEKLDKKDVFGKSDPYFEISRVNESGDYSVVFRSEVISNTLDPKWRQFKIETRTFCNGDYDRTLQIVVFDKDNDGSSDLIGSFKTNLRKLINGPGTDNIYECINEKKRAKKGSKYKNSGVMKLTQIHLEQIPSFLEFIQGGMQLNFTVAIDFTGSNGPPSDPRSLHYKDPSGAPNQYVTAIQAVGDIIQDYDSDKMFPCLGFGARIPPHGQVSHEFFLNLDSNNPFCAGVSGIISAYHTSLNMVQLHGPTNFSPVINHVAQFASAHQSDPTNYFVLLIITDGIITDFEETKAAIARVCQLPLSIIIVGVGNEDFSSMEVLDGDRGKLASRDIVQFVEMNRFLVHSQNGVNGFPLWSKESLAKSVLAEVPSQVTSWMKNKGFKPRNQSATS